MWNSQNPFSAVRSPPPALGPSRTNTTSVPLCVCLQNSSKLDSVFILSQIFMLTLINMAVGPKEPTFFERHFKSAWSEKFEKICIPCETWSGERESFPPDIHIRTLSLSFDFYNIPVRTYLMVWSRERESFPPDKQTRTLSLSFSCYRFVPTSWCEAGKGNTSHQTNILRLCLCPLRSTVPYLPHGAKQGKGILPTRQTDQDSVSVL